MLSVLSSAGLAASSTEIVVADHQRGRDNFTGHTARERNSLNRSTAVSVGSGLCPHPNSMGGNSGPAIPRIPPIIMPPLTTTCTATTTGDYSPPSPRLYPSPYSPAGIPYYQNTSSLPSVPPPPSHPNHHPSSPAASAHYFFPFTHHNPYPRHYIQIDPNYSATALAPTLQNSSAAAQIRPFPRTAPIFTVSTGNHPTSPSPTQYSVFPFPPPHLPLHPPSMTPFPTSAAASSTSSASEHSGLPLFAAPNNSPVRLTSYSPEERSPSSISPHSQISHHSSSPGVISAGNTKSGSVGDITHSSTSSVSFSAANIHHGRSSSSSSGGSGGGGGRDLSLKHRLLVRPNHQAHNQDQRQHTRNASTSHLPTASSHVNIDHVVNKLRSSTPKRSKSSSTSSSSNISSTSRPPSSQPPTTPSAVTANSTPGRLTSSRSEGNGKLMRPLHFHKGSLIELSSGELKYVENLSVDDFRNCADLSSNLQIDSSKVVKIEHMDNPENEEAIVRLGFIVGKQNLQVSVDATVEHPFFVYGKGWSSCCPKMSLHRFSLECHQLAVGDVCISLTHKKQDKRNAKTRGSTTSASNVVAVNGTYENSKAIAAVNNNNNTNTNVGTKTSYLRGTVAKRKRRWSESDAAQCRLPNSENNGSEVASGVVIHTPFTKVANN